MIEIPTFKTQVKCLSDAEFDSLSKIIRLLRVSEIRYIVHKFELPLKANKTKLISDLISLFNLLKKNEILCDIYDEINQLISNKDKMSIKNINIASHDPRFFSPPNPTFSQANPPYILGPFSVSPGNSCGKFSFIYIENESTLGFEKFINISFLFLEGVSHQFELEGNFNGFPIEVSIDDPCPQPVDITDLINLGPDSNNFVIKNIHSPKPMMICIREYEYNGIQNLMDQIIGHKTDIDKDDFYVYSKLCDHEGTFSLVNFLSGSMATGQFQCPICQKRINPFDLIILGPRI